MIARLICRWRGHVWTDDQDTDINEFLVIVGVICARCHLTARSG